jgi:hypothetical protein
MMAGMKRVWVLSALFLVLGSVACEDDDPVCPPVVAPALVVTIVDSLTGAPRSGIATAIATDGTYVDTLQPYAIDGLGTELSKAGAYGRPGTYDLRVIAPGYLEWTRASIATRSGECGVNPTGVEAQLTALPQPKLVMEYEKLAATSPSITTAGLEDGALVVRGKSSTADAGYELTGHVEFRQDNRCVLTLVAERRGPGATIGVDFIYTARVTDLPARSFELVVRHEWSDRSRNSMDVLIQTIDP